VPGRSGYHNRVGEGLTSGRFLITVEFASPLARQPLDVAIRPILELARQIQADPGVDAITLTDRSRSDHDPIALGHRVAEVCGKRSWRRGQASRNAASRSSAR